MLDIAYENKCGVMEKSQVRALAIAGALILLMPLELVAQTTDFGSAEIVSQATKIQQFLFGPTMRLAGIIGGAYGLIQAILSSSLKPLLVFGGIGLAVNIIPKFIDGIYGVSGMMLP
jgi:hypothetical protein